MGSSTATVWRQLQKDTKIRAETWLKLMRSLGNLDIDFEECIVKIKVRALPENRQILKRVFYCDFKEDYGESTKRDNQA
jgi:hypothetical protein